MSASKIEWTEQTWNPIIGCSIVSPGCTNCYAMKMAARTEAMGISRYDGMTNKVNGNAVWTGKLARAPRKTLLAPLKRKKPTTYFVNSMGDLFHEDCPDEWIDEVFAVMALCPQHTFQVLTKRARRMHHYIASKLEKSPEWILLKEAGGKVLLPYEGGWPTNVWLGVSTERQQEANERIPHLLQTAASVRFISAEPLLGPINLNEIDCGGDIKWSALGGNGRKGGIDWVIVGGESGATARPMHPDWARDLRDQCSQSGVPFFFKQWGEWADCEDWPSEMQEHLELINRADGNSVRVGKKRAGRKLDGVFHDAMPPRIAHGTLPAHG